MNPRSLIRFVSVALSAALLPFAAAAGEGLVAPSPEALWPQWQARISLQSASVSPVSPSSPSSTSHLLDGTATPRMWQGGSVLGDYYFFSPGFGSFRASGGLMMGLQGGTPLLSANAGPRLGLSVQGSGNSAAAGADNPGTVPYLGFGFSGGAWRNALSVTADLGLVAERPGAASGVGRALFGNQGFENALREMRVSPVLQVGLRYTF